MIDANNNYDHDEDLSRGKEHLDDLEESKDDIRIMKENINNRSFRDD